MSNVALYFAVQVSPNDDGVVTFPEYIENVVQVTITPVEDTEISNVKVHVCGQGK